MALPPVFAILGPLSDPDWDVVEDWYPTPDIIEVPYGPKYIIMCTATNGKIQEIDFKEDSKGELTQTKKSIQYEKITAKIQLLQHPQHKIEQIQFQKTNFFLSRPTTAKGYTSIPIYNLITTRSLWYFAIENKFKRKLSSYEVNELVTNGA